MSRMLFANIAVADLPGRRAFFDGLGFEFDPQMSNDDAALMKINDQTFVILHTPEHFATFLPGTTAADPTTTTEVLLALSADSREGVDELADAALAAGATPALEAQDHGFMYGRSFRDLDGHVWEVTWMDLEAAFSEQ